MIGERWVVFFSLGNFGGNANVFQKTRVKEKAGKEQLSGASPTKVNPFKRFLSKRGKLGTVSMLNVATSSQHSPSDGCVLARYWALRCRDVRTHSAGEAAEPDSVLQSPISMSVTHSTHLCV